jgi:predicted metal-dependent phosphoesterase TrpH
VFADLHLHTRFSDGTYTPEELAAAASRKGLSAIALTDHDTVEGCAPTAEACRREGIEFIPGSELTAQMNDHEIHVLAYFVDTQNPALLAELAKFQKVRQDRIREMVSRINQMGIPLLVEDVFTLANCRSPGRPHVARALTEGEFCGSLDEAFERFLKKGRPAWVPKFKMSAPEAIALIHQAGGLAVMAHPGLTRADEFIPTLAENGLDGLECYHTKHTGVVAAQYRAMAERLQLLVTGGSDCHGTTKGKPLIGTVKLPYEHVERLKTRVTERAAEKGFHLASNSGTGALRP